MNTWKIVVLALTILLVYGCATPSYQKKVWDKEGNLLEEEIKWENSTFVSGKAIGLKVGYDPESKSPVVKLIYGRYESARVYYKSSFSNDLDLKDMDLWGLGLGSSKHRIEVRPLKLDITGETDVKIYESTSPAGDYR